MTKEEILNKAHLDFVTANGTSSIHTKNFPEAYQQQAINAMTKYADLRCKPLVEALEGIIKIKEATQSTQELFMVLREIDNAKNILQDYNKK